LRILFLCGSLEPGRDGVGDYVRRLASELLRQYHFVSVIALNDRFVSTLYEGSEQEDDLGLIRIPDKYSNDQKLSITKEWIHKFNADWISLQFVPFSFHHKGLPVNFSKFLKSIQGNHKWHIMFHELWTITKSSMPSKIKLTGFIQKQIIKQLVKKLKPGVVHTQAQFSRHRLREAGISAEILPLFSNIPSIKEPKKEEAFRKPGTQIKIVSFGSIYPNALINQFAKDASLYGQKHNVRITLTLLGHSGPQQFSWAAAWRGAGLKIDVLGEMPAENISEILIASTVGISSTPFVMMEKSGSVAAMREHGLPVICIADQYSPKGFKFHPPDGIIDYFSNGFDKCICYQSAHNSHQTVSAIAQDFSAALMC
jgi:hypothetical protein